MPAAEAEIETDRPSRYLVQLCKHAASMNGGHHGARRHSSSAGRGEVDVQAEWSATRGVVTFKPWGRCTLTAESAKLNLCVEANREDDLRRIQEIVASDIDRFGRRDGLKVRWRPSEPPQVASRSG